MRRCPASHIAVCEARSGSARFSRRCRFAVRSRSDRYHAPPTRPTTCFSVACESSGVAQLGRYERVRARLAAVTVVVTPLRSHASWSDSLSVGPAPGAMRPWCVPSRSSCSMNRCACVARSHRDGLVLTALVESGPPAGSSMETTHPRLASRITNCSHELRSSAGTVVTLAGPRPLAHPPDTHTTPTQTRCLHYPV